MLAHIVRVMPDGQFKFDTALAAAPFTS